MNSKRPLKALNKLSLLLIITVFGIPTILSAATLPLCRFKTDGLTHERFLRAFHAVNDPFVDPIVKPAPATLANWNANRSKFQMSEDEAQSIFSYTGRGFFINRDLRQPCPTENALIYAQVLNQGLDKLPPFVGEVRRNILAFPGWKDQYAVGNDVQELAFLSATRLRQYNAGVSRLGLEPELLRFVIQSATGKDVSAFSFYPQELEILFKAPTWFHVTAMTEVDDFLDRDGQPLHGWEIHLVEISNIKQ